MVEENAVIREIRERLEAYLMGKDFYFNPNSDTVESILKAMAKRREQYGADYCPCRRVTGDEEKDKDIICPCIYHLDEIAKDGRCHCHLFTSF